MIRTNPLSAWSGALAASVLFFSAHTEAQTPLPAADPEPPSGASRVGLGLSNPLRTSRFDTTLGLSPAVFGAGDQQSSDDVKAEIVFALLPRWSFVDTPTDWAWVGARVAWSFDASQNDVTTQRRRVAFEDIELDAAYSRTLVRTAGGLVLLLGPRLGFAFPTSPVSRGASVYLRTSLGVGADLHVPLARGHWFTGLFVSASGTWQHAFGASPSSSFNFPITTTGGSPPAPVGIALMDQNRFFAGAAIPNAGQLSALLGTWLTIYRDLSLGITWGLAGGYSKPITTPSCIQAASGCVTLSSASPSTVPTTIFDVALGYAIADVVWLAVGYDHMAAGLREDGKRRSVFYSPDARFYLQLGLLADGVFAKLKK